MRSPGYWAESSERDMEKMLTPLISFMLYSSKAMLCSRNLSSSGCACGKKIKIECIHSKFTLRLNSLDIILDIIFFF